MACKIDKLVIDCHLSAEQLSGSRLDYPMSHDLCIFQSMVLLQAENNFDCILCYKLI